MESTPGFDMYDSGAYVLDRETSNDGVNVNDEKRHVENHDWERRFEPSTA